MRVCCAVYHYYQVFDFKDVAVVRRSETAFALHSSDVAMLRAVDIERIAKDYPVLKTHMLERIGKKKAIHGRRRARSVDLGNRRNNGVNGSSSDRHATTATEAGMGTASAGRAQEVEENIVQDFLRVRLKIIRNARIENAGKYQSCMVSKLWIICKQTETETEKSIGRRADDDGGGGGGGGMLRATAIGGHEQLAQLEKRLLRQMERQHAQLSDRIDKLLSLQQQQCGALKQHAAVDVV